ncbi:MAG TPA: shikimate kinase [Candidatus Polarisedimenticolia bacterium]|nr:shikimate kinase [Candidatus Polarisedimenticolia bacterium]
MTSWRRDRIYLVGFMGSGKSSVGAALARELGYRFVDLDQEIERRAGLEVAAIFERQGEAGFRRLEAAALRQTVEMHDVVVATGGGTLTRRENRELVQKNGLTVWLDAPLEVMLDRCRGGARRPLLSTSDRMAALLDERLPAYRASDLRVSTRDVTPEQAARAAAAQLASRLK